RSIQYSLADYGLAPTPYHESHILIQCSQNNPQGNRMSDDVHDILSTTPDLQTELARKLHELVPEAIADGKVDVTKLKELLAEDVADDSERFGLFWPGKRRALRAAQEPTTATLRPAR